MLNATLQTFSHLYYSKATIYGAYQTHDSLFLALQTLPAWCAAHKESLSLEKADAVRGEICWIVMENPTFSWMQDSWWQHKQIMWTTRWRGGLPMMHLVQAMSLPPFHPTTPRHPFKKQTPQSIGRILGGGGGVVWWWKQAEAFPCERREGRGKGGRGRCLKTVWQSLLVWAAVVQRVNHEGQIRPGRHHGVARLHHLKAHVVERLDDGHCWEETDVWWVSLPVKFIWVLGLQQ